MKAGKLFEILVKHILMNIGFMEVNSDGLYVYDAAPGQMIQGLGEAHNADVLLEPPVQIPFYTMSRILIECKDYTKKVGLNVIRSALGLREDINNFDIVDKNELTNRRNTRRTNLTYNFTRYHYQVAVASLSGFTIPAQKFAATHRISLIEFDKMPFWNDFCNYLKNQGGFNDPYGLHLNKDYININEDNTIRCVTDFADNIGKSMALAITNSGQLLFLYNIDKEPIKFGDSYSLYWTNDDKLWQLKTDNKTYVFQLPQAIADEWLYNVHSELELRKEAIRCKTQYLSSMVVYYAENFMPKIKMISIDKYELDKAYKKLNKEE